MLCNVTGTVYLPNGQLGKSLTLRFKRVDQRVTAEYLGAVVPNDVYTQSDRSGQVDFDILTGVYVMHVEGGYSVRAIVPDAATADISDCIDAAAVPDQPPVWYQQALNARDEAVDAADRAEDAADSVAGSVVADYFVATDADRLALSPSAGQTVYVSQTGHTWEWNGTTWVDMGVAPFALESEVDLKADQAEVDGIKSADTLADNSVPLITIGSDETPQDVLRLVPGQHGGLLGNYVTDLHEPAPDDGYIIERMNGGALRKLYPDGQDFIPSQRFLDRLPSESGGGETADGWATVDGRFTAEAGQHGVIAVDRFIDRADGVRLPVPEINGQPRKAFIISLYGQSNADVTRMGDDLIWDTPPFPYHAFMLDDMNPFGSTNHRGGMMGWQGVAVQRGDRMINASEAARDTQSYGSAALSRLLMWGGLLRRVGLIRSSAWGGNRLVGTTATTGIWKGSTGDYTQSWINWTGDIQQSYDLLTDEGYEVEAVYICFTHQEADWQTDRTQYLADFLAMKAEREALIEASFPGIRVHWFLDQASGSGLRTGTYRGGAWPVRMAIADAADEADNITMVMPRYWLNFGLTQGGAQEDIHHSYRARIWQGEVYAHAMRAMEQGREWRCPRMASATVNGNDVIVDFDSLLPLVIDQTFCKVRPDMGFTVDGGAVEVTDVRLSGQRQITVTCAAAPTISIAYAYREFDAEDVLDEWPISTGAIRDAWEAPSQFDPGKKLVRAALGGIINL